MLEDDIEVAAYRDAVLRRGAFTELTSKETMVVCKKILSGGSDLVTRRLMAIGLFVIDDMGGALLAVPRDKKIVGAVALELRRAGLEAAAEKITRSAKK